MRKQIICLVLLSMLMSLTHAMTFEYRNVESGTEKLFLTGPIIEGDTERFERFISVDPERFILANPLRLDSPGGDVQEAMKMAILFRRLLVSVSVL
ncbi:MAG: hypothetical protein JSS28_12320, partial [Proteobacteria bacterium]|nr:hypothetical protein [Pseudomonadota bacterium]